MSTIPGWTLAATALTSMSGALPWDGRYGRGLNRPEPGRVGPAAGFGAGAAVTVGRDRWMSIRSMAAQAATTIDTTSATTSAAVSRLGPRPAGAGGGGGGGAGMAPGGTNHGDGTLHAGGSARVVRSSPAGRSSSM